MELPRASQAPQPGMLFKASEDHSSPQLWTRHEVGGGERPAKKGLTEFLTVSFRPVGWSRTSGQGTDAAPSGHTDGGILRLAFHMGDQEPESVFTLLQVAVPL